MKNSIVLLFILTLVLSCSSDDDCNSHIQENNDSTFYGLKTGNSWVYKSYIYNSNTDDYINSGIIDSVSVVGTEEIFENTYFKLRTFTTGNDDDSPYSNSNGESFQFLREVNGVLIDENNEVLFLRNDYSERVILENNAYTLYAKLIEGTIQISIEAGVFNCLEQQLYAINNVGETLPGVSKTFYSDGVGLISDEISLLSQDMPIVIRRLDSYDLNQ